MTLAELTDAMLDFVASKGWLKPDSAHPQTPKNLAVSLVLESSEVIDITHIARAFQRVFDELVEFIHIDVCPELRRQIVDWQTLVTTCR